MLYSILQNDIQCAMMYLQILLWRFEALQMYLFYCVIVQIIVEQNPVIPKINSGATYYTIYSNTCKIVFILLFIIYIYYILYTYLKNITKCNVYYRPDMAENRSDMDCE